MSTNGQILTSIIKRITPEIQTIANELASKKPGPKRWSKKEILGHLIDSACNNHRRFVLAHTQDNLVFDGYRQEDWVLFQDYQTSDWITLCNLWESYNLHLADVVDKIPQATLTREHKSHSLDTMAWKRTPPDGSITLDYLIKDYIGHLEHHVRQILPDYEPVMMGTYEL